MRLQLDAAVTGTGITGAGETGQTVSAGGSGSDSRRIGGDAGGTDSIQISGASSALNRLSTDRAARIQQLTAQVETGSYNVPASEVSQAIVGHAVSLAGSGA
jgi:anti-sigma28 factor (negative regulator of flagellin synthesis)